jgi:hypothetical protein
MSDGSDSLSRLFVRISFGDPVLCISLKESIFVRSQRLATLSLAGVSLAAASLATLSPMSADGAARSENVTIRIVASAANNGELDECG